MQKKIQTQTEDTKPQERSTKQNRKHSFHQERNVFCMLRQESPIIPTIACWSCDLCVQKVKCVSDQNHKQLSTLHLAGVFNASLSAHLLTHYDPSRHNQLHCHYPHHYHRHHCRHHRQKQLQRSDRISSRTMSYHQSETGNHEPLVT